MYQALYRKWRPRTFDEVAGQEHITETLKAQIIKGRISHAYLFTGSRGTGKTTCAKILAKAVNCENPQSGNPCNVCPSCIGIDEGSIMDVSEIDAASNNGVEHVRALRDEAIYTPATVKKRVYIIDEVHMLSTAAFNALLKIMEEPPEHLVFILATTELHKVPATILSRCQRYAFKRLLAPTIAQRLMLIAGAEGIDLDEPAAQLLARLSEGALRDAISLLDQCAGGGKIVDAASVHSSLGLAGKARITELLEAVAKHDPAGALGILNEEYSAGRDIASVLDELCSLCRDLLMLKTAPVNGKALITIEYDESLEAINSSFSSDELIALTTELQATLSGMSKSANRRLNAELCILRLCSPVLSGNMESLSARVSALEKGGRLTARNDKADDMTAKKFCKVPKSNDEASQEDSPEEKCGQSAIVEGGLSETGAIVSDDSDGPKAYWKKIIEKAKDNLSRPEYLYLTNPETATARLNGRVLSVEASNSFILNAIKASQNTLKTAAESVLGQEIELRISVGTGFNKETDVEALIKKKFG